MLMDEKTKQKLFVWGQLYRQCEQLEMKLDEVGSDADAIHADLKELRERTEAAFKEAYQSLKKADSETSHGEMPR
jgi:vacuolar-type H+-ATPase subunit D/Vma8